MAGRYQFDTHLTEIGLKKRLCKNSLEGPVPVVPLLFIDYHLFVDQGLNRFKSIYSKMINEKVLHIMLEKEFVSSMSANYMKTCIMNNLIVIESLTSSLLPQRGRSSRLSLLLLRQWVYRGKFHRNYVQKFHLTDYKYKKWYLVQRVPILCRDILFE